MRARVMWWAAAVCVGGLVAPGTLTAVGQAGGGPVPDAGGVQPVGPDGRGVARSTRADATTTTTTVASGAVAVARSGSATSGAGGGNGRCNPYCSDLSLPLPPLPPSNYDPFANCPHRWQVEQSTGRLVDTGCASEPYPPVSVDIAPPSTFPPPVIHPAPVPTTTTTAPPPPTTAPPTTAPTTTVTSTSP